MKPDLSVIIPAYNEAENVSAIMDAFKNFLKRTSINIQLVFVDDGSSDNTIDCISEYTYIGCEVKIVKLSRNFGSHAAIRAGIKSADADDCMFYYMDMSEPIDYIETYYKELKNGYNLVYSDRIGYKGSLGSRIFAKLVVKYIEQTYPLKGVSVLAFDKKIKDELNNNIENNSSIFFQIFQLGYKKRAILTEHIERKRGASKWTLKKKIKLFIDSFVMFSYMPIRMISGIGIILAILGFIWAIFIIICKLFNLIDFSLGWPTISSILLIGFGITNISLGIISEYLVRTLDASRKRPVFIIDEVYYKDANTN